MVDHDIAWVPVGTNLYHIDIKLILKLTTKLTMS